MTTTQELLDQTNEAIQAVLAGAQEYTIGNYTCKRPELRTLMAYRANLQAELQREALGNNGPIMTTVRMK